MYLIPYIEVAVGFAFAEAYDIGYRDFKRKKLKISLCRTFSDWLIDSKNINAFSYILSMIFLKSVVSKRKKMAFLRGRFFFFELDVKIKYLCWFLKYKYILLTDKSLRSFNFLGETFVSKIYLPFFTSA